MDGKWHFGLHIFCVPTNSRWKEPKNLEHIAGWCCWRVSNAGSFQWRHVSSGLSEVHQRRCEADSAGGRCYQTAAAWIRQTQARTRSTDRWPECWCDRGPYQVTAVCNVEWMNEWVNGLIYHQHLGGLVAQWLGRWIYERDILLDLCSVAPSISYSLIMSKLVFDDQHPQSPDEGKNDRHIRG